MPYYKRRLPHWDPEDAALFITWRLHGSYPAPSPEWERLPPGQRFAAEDTELAHLATGPHYLRDPRVAQTVADTLKYGANHLHLYDLRAWVIMSNHVHILIDPHAELTSITSRIKSFSAREANRILNRTGQPFWALESYDHWVRSTRESDHIVRYIEFNPLKAGIVEKPEDYRWSSASAGREARVT
ncbi:MAG TPA: transposase [Verrucomicrobiae bacterium]|nr:transposase [Verrucomicrobiae bacterium]